MKTSAALLFGVVLCAVPAFSQTESEIRDRIVGTWKLVSAEDIIPLTNSISNVYGQVMKQTIGDLFQK